MLVLYHRAMDFVVNKDHPEKQARDRDRRLLPRAGNGDTRNSAQKIRWIVMAFAVAGMAVAGSALFLGFVSETISFDLMIVTCTVGIFLAAFLQSYAVSLRQYHNHPTLGTLANCFEKQLNFWILLSLSVVVFGVGIILAAH